MRAKQQPFAVIGLFLVLLGAGIILDGNRTRSGSILIIAGIASMLAAWRQGPPGTGSSQ